MDADLQVQALVLALGAEIARRFAHADRGGNGAIRRLEGRHHSIADGLHDGALFGAYDLLKHPEMLSDEIESNEITDPGIKFGRAFEVAEQESKAQDLETLADGERIGPIDVAEGLIGEEALRGKYRLAPLKKATGSPPIRPAVLDCQYDSRMLGAAARGARPPYQLGPVC